MLENTEEKTLTPENTAPPVDPSTRFVSDFGILESELNSFLELPPDAAKKAALEKQGDLEDMRNALSDLRIQIWDLLHLLKAYRASQTALEPIPPSRSAGLDGMEILENIRCVTVACRESFGQTISNGNPAETTHKECKPTVLARRLEQTGLMMDDLVLFFEKIGSLNPVILPPRQAPIFDPPMPAKTQTQAKPEPIDEQPDSVPLSEDQKTLAEELAEHFLLIASRFGLPKPLKIAKGYGQHYPGLVGENLHVLERSYLDDEMARSLERLFCPSPNDELLMVRRGNRFRLAIVNKTALIDPTPIPKKSQQAKRW